jgi:hypothetical protein
MNHKQTQLEWLITMSKQEAFKAYAWHRAQELDKDASGLFTGIAKDLERAMKQYNAEQSKIGE